MRQARAAQGTTERHWSHEQRVGRGDKAKHNRERRGRRERERKERREGPRKCIHQRLLQNAKVTSSRMCVRHKKTQLEGMEGRK